MIDVNASTRPFDQKPTFRDVFVGPIPSDIGSNPEDQVIMVAHDGIIANIDSEDRREQSDPVMQPTLAMFISLIGFGIEAAEECSADASRYAMIEPDFGGVHEFFARMSGHCGFLDWVFIERSESEVWVTRIRRPRPSDRKVNLNKSIKLMRGVNDVVRVDSNCVVLIEYDVL